MWQRSLKMKQIRAPRGSWDFDGFLLLLLLLLKLTNSTLQYLIQKQKCHAFQTPLIGGGREDPLRNCCPSKSHVPPGGLSLAPPPPCLAGGLGSLGHRCSFNAWGVPEPTALANSGFPSEREPSALGQPAASGPLRSRAEASLPGQDPQHPAEALEARGMAAPRTVINLIL